MTEPPQLSPQAYSPRQFHSFNGFQPQPSPASTSQQQQAIDPFFFMNNSPYPPTIQVMTNKTRNIVYLNLFIY
jgi:hypothetical protein